MANLVRLQIMANYLRDLNPGRKEFNLTKWAEYGYVWGPIRCGFAGCALGWAAADKVFDELRLAPGSNPNRMVVQYGDDEEDQDFEAAARLFGISGEQAMLFFSPNNYPHEDHLDGMISFATPKMVAEKIYAFIATVQDAERTQARIKATADAIMQAAQVKPDLRDWRSMNEQELFDALTPYMEPPRE